jgi:hypothetical protein
VKRARPRERASSGFSLVELLIASGIASAVTLFACRFALDAQKTWQAESGRADLQQRGRVVVDALTRALMEAGGGAQSGAGRGPLLRSVAPILPRRAGLRGAHPATEFRSDALTVTRVVAESEHGTLLASASSSASQIEIAAAGACALPACGFSPGTSVMLFDGAGQYDIFTVTAVDGVVLAVRPHGPGSAATYSPGTPVVAVETAAYSFDEPSRALRMYDGDAADVPLVDDVVGVEVRYWGDPRAPVWPRPAAGQTNCLYASDGSYQSALMPTLAGPSPVELAAADLTDGPWCGTGDNIFDADILRVRRVRIAVRLQVSDPALRGADSARFTNPGSARSAAAMVADLSVVIDVTPRNLAAGW